MKLSDAIEDLLVSTRANGRSERTVSDYAQKLAPLVEYLCDPELEDITAIDLRRYVADLRSRSCRYKAHPNRKVIADGLSPASIAGYLRALRRLFRFAEAEGYICENPARSIHVPKPRERRPKAISMHDFAKLLKAIDGNAVNDVRNRAILLLLADSAARVGGLVGIRLSDLNLEQGTVYLREKGGKGRYAFFSSATREALQAWLQVRPANGSDRLFVNLGKQIGVPLTTQAVSEVLRRLKVRAGVSGHANPHSFRHGFAREYLKNGGNLASLADIMGHSDVQITWQAYAVFTIEELKAAHARYSPVAYLEQRGLL